MEQPSAEHALKVIACRLSPSLIAEAQRYANLYHSSVSTLLREGLELRLQELRLHRVAFGSSSAVPSAMSPATVAMLGQLASTLSTAAEEVRNVCQQGLGEEAYNGNTSLGEEEYNGNTVQEEQASNGNTIARKEASNGNTSGAPVAPVPDAPELRRATKRGKRNVSPAEPVPELSHDYNTVIQKEGTTHEQQAESAHPSSAVPVRRTLHKLTPLQVNTLQTKRACGVPVKALMEEYGVSKATVFRYLAEAQPPAPLASPVPRRRVARSAPRA